MTQAIRVDSRFATPYRTAKVLGVSKSRTKELIELAGRFTDRLLGQQVARAGQSAVNGRTKRKSAASVRRKRSADGGSKISTTKAKRAKAER
jgi:hypothetical protein